MGRVGRLEAKADLESDLGRADKSSKEGESFTAPINVVLRSSPENRSDHLKPKAPHAPAFTEPKAALFSFLGTKLGYIIGKLSTQLNHESIVLLAQKVSDRQYKEGQACLYSYRIACRHSHHCDTSGYAIACPGQG